MGKPLRKMQARLEKRIKTYEDDLKGLSPGRAAGRRRPGSMRRRP